MYKIINKTFSSIVYKDRTICNFMYVDSLDKEILDLAQQKFVKIEEVEKVNTKEVKENEKKERKKKLNEEVIK